MSQSFLQIMEESVKRNWELPALTDYKGTTFQYKEIARKIAKLHILFEAAGIRKGDKIALIGRNSSNWAVVFIATLSYGAVVVPILHEFKPENVHHIVNHSEARLLFTGDAIWENLNPSSMIRINAIYSVDSFDLLYTTNENNRQVFEHLNQKFGEKYPKSFGQNDLVFHKDEPDELALISYTSGTTSHSKGVMLPYRTLWSNWMFANEVLPSITQQSNVVSLLPMAHMYGMAFEFLYEFGKGAHIHFLTRNPSPKVIFEAFQEIRPDIIIAVPLIIEKIYRKQIQPIIERPAIKAMLKLPVLDTTITDKVRSTLVEAFGGKFIEVIIGGAAFNRETEDFFKRMKFPYTVGYGMTECGPIISYAPWASHAVHSCGKAAPRMEIKIDSASPSEIPGEILVKGTNVMLGYYKNEAATRAVFTEDGWMKTGDMGILDAEGNLFIKGRCKTMILGASGQNIYPEEIEDQINTMNMVSESLVIEASGKLEALVYPDFETADRNGLSLADLEIIMEQNRVAVNAVLPAYSQISRIRIMTEEFEKTPKRSIKRFLYQATKE
ncbi:MAG: AMP-binding protein [Bacteroidales bacterium]|nr:AMP-binding protein [Bacteroidales bacterium]